MITYVARKGLSGLSWSMFIQLLNACVARKSRIDRILAAHPCLKAEDARLILCYYYSKEWQLPDATIDEVRVSLENITLSLLDAETSAVEHFVDRIKLFNKLLNSLSLSQSQGFF